MKKVRVAAAMVLAVAVGAATLTACSDGNLDASKFKISNYAHSLDSVYSKVNRTDYADNAVNKEVRTFTKLTGFDTISESYGKYIKVRVDDNYSLYDAEANRIIYNNYNYISRIYPADFNIYFNIYVLQKTSGGKYQFAGPDGALLTNKSFDSNYISVSSMGLAQSVTGTEESISYYKITLGNEGQTALYFSMTSYYDKEDKWESVTEAQAKEAIGEKYTVGTQLGLDTEKIDVNNELYPVNNYQGIEYSKEGSEIKTTYTYYKNGEKLSSVTVNMGEIVGYVGDYVYYYEMELAKSDATKGYNFEMTAVATVKANISLYRYNFIKGGGKMAVDMGGYVISPDVSAMSLYNYSTDKIDAIVVPAIRKVGGVAVASGTFSSSGNFTIVNSSLIVLNSSGKAIADLSGTNLSSLNVYKLEEGKYLAGNYILDEKLNTVAKLPGTSSVWAEKQLISTYVYGYGNMLVNYNGKVVMEPKTSLTFYGDTALGSDGKVYSITDTEAKEIEKIVSCSDGEILTVNSGFLVKSAYDSSSSSYTLTMYTLKGNRIVTINNCTDNSIYVSSYGEAKIFRVTIRENSSIKYVYYKLG